MPEDDKKVKLLSMIVLLLSVVCSLCLGTVTYVMVTKELPFEIQQHFLFDDKNYGPLDDEYKAADIPINASSVDEVTLLKLHDKLKQKEMDLSEKLKNYEQTKGMLDDLNMTSMKIKEETAKKLAEIQQERKDKAAEIKQLMADLDAEREKFDEEKKNVDAAIITKIASTLASMKPSTAMIIINDLDVTESARLLNQMTKEQRSDIIAQMIEITDFGGKTLKDTERLNFRRKANEIILEIRKLKDPGVTP